MSSIILSVVIPVYNEELTVEKVINDHLKVLKESEPFLENWEILCLDDASTDGSYRILTRLAQENEKIRVLRHQMNQGICISFDDLFQAAKGTHIYVTASDDQWPAENLKRLLRSTIENAYDLTIGVRENRKDVYGLWRRFLSFTFNFIPQILYNVKTEDANGIKLGRREIFTLKLKSKSFFAEIERIIEATKKGYQIGFAPIEFLSRTKGKAKGAKWSNIFMTLKDLMKYIYQTRLKRT